MMLFEEMMEQEVGWARVKWGLQLGVGWSVGL